MRHIGDMNPREDQHIISDVLSGQVSAYSELVEKYQSLAFTLAIRMVGNKQEAEEVAQDAFIKAYGSLKSFRGSSKFSSWLYRIIYNTSISLLRKRQRERKVFDDNRNVEIQFMADEIYYQDNEYTMMALEKSMESLEPEEKFIVSLFYYENSAISEIARITGLSESNVKVKLHRSRKKLYDKLKSLRIRRPVLN
jgi:RNA polymerase sigma factor (sigma-70 family)